MRLFFWTWLGFLALKLSGFLGSRKSERDEERIAYFKEAEMARLHGYAI